jgi:acyl-coenzyme A synthetase/AMP-(fatty) acid ligase
MNVFLPIWRNGQAFPDRLALVIEGREITYGELLRITALASARLARAGVARGDCVALSIGRPGPYLLTALAVARLGGIVTPFDVTWPSERAAAILSRHSVRIVVRDFGEEWRHPALAEDRYLHAKDLMAAPPAGTSVNVPGIAMDIGGQPWMIALSSGTTGTPKSIPQTHDRALLYACLPTVHSTTADLDRFFVFASTHLGMTMYTILHQLIAGRTAILANERTPENFFRVVERDRPTYVKTSTGTAIRLVAYAAKSQVDSRERCVSMRGMSIVGSSASPSLCGDIVKYICPNLEINYASAEAGRIAEATAETLAARPASAGRLRPWVEMEVLDEQGNTVPPGQCGVLRVRTPLLVSGYIGDPDATARAFRDGWFYPGDTGSLDNAGYLTLTGRVDERLNFGGNKIDPVAIEAVLDAQPGIEESAVVAVQPKAGGSVMVAVVVAAVPIDEAALKKMCGERLGMHCMPARIVMAQSIPRNSGGKIMRKEIADMLALRVRGQDSSDTVH